MDVLVVTELLYVIVTVILCCYWPSPSKLLLCIMSYTSPIPSCKPLSQVCAPDYAIIMLLLLLLLSELFMTLIKVFIDRSV